MQRLAIVGTGIAGLGAAYYLKDRYEVTLFEKNNYAGGHTNTVDVAGRHGPQSIDTGFIVYNEKTYPNLVRLFRDLQIATEPSNMSFSMHDQDSGLQFSGQSVSTLFAQRRRILSPAHWKFLAEANRFNVTAPQHLEAGRAEGPLEQYLIERGYSERFRESYVYPMASAVWSTAPGRVRHFPAATFIRFFHNHGFLGMNTQLQWRTVSGGARNYVQRIRAAVGARTYLNDPVRSVERDGDRVVVRTENGQQEFDRVLVATHADQALAMLKDPTALEVALLGRFRYENNQALLHTDSGVMPPLRRVWSSWNYKTQIGRDGVRRAATVYYMNRLQNIPGPTDYFVSINDYEDVEPSRILRTINYEHPLFDLAAVRAQDELSRLNESGPVFFAGSYFRYGFHEDALWSGLQAAKRLGHAREPVVSV
ncbi:MAG: FAD-dependent oxidoreductase [Spirochaetales bacterium]|nr:FAD-dependent oxidoreductase [Leptospiraceae bacterium]MCP5480314.1 FAD-dependent oxidoreductase [Spirochaetales bacterium]